DLTSKSVENFMVAQMEGGVFNSGNAMTAPFNRKKSNNEGGAAITINNKELFFTVNIGGNFDIYYSKFVNGKWTEIESVSENVNDPVRWDSQPSISSDGRTLYFSSYRDSVTEKSDIYQSKRNKSGEWSAPKKLSSVINTIGNEKSPFIHSDSRTLYFSSDKLAGMGGFDIFYSKLKDDNTWTQPVNIGYPINTEADEVGFFVSLDGKTAYFASDALDGIGGYDIYSFELYKEARPEKVLFVKGTLKDSNNEVPKKAKIELKSVSTKEIHEIEYDTTSGEYASVVLFKDDLMMTVEKEGSNFNSYYFSADDTATTQPQKVDFEIKKLITGQNFNLNNILFETNSFELNEVANNVINYFSEYLKRNPKLKVEIQGHTDDVGDDNENLELSNNRALAVFNRLKDLGIGESRIAYKGYGETHPVEENKSEEGRMKNRRTEIVVVSN
ncbi:MAG: OmpA family protein, partial [Bacteroidia bacterium]|nr:OmpA family protein [Bacteroidia bacterium]